MSARLARQLELDWSLVQLRWLLFAIALFLALLPPTELSLPFVAIAAIAIAYNTALAILARRRAAPLHLDQPTALGDVLLIGALAWTSGRGDSPLPLLMLIPVLVASLRRGWAGGAPALLTSLLWVALSLSGRDGPATSAEVARLTGWLGLLACLLVVGVKLGRLARARAQALEQQGRDRIRLAEEQARAMYELTGALSATLDYGRVLDAILDVALLGLRDLAGQQDETAGLVLLFDEAGGPGPLRIAASRRLSEDEAGQVLEARQGLLAELVSAGEPRVVADPGLDPELGALPSLRNLRSAAAVPLRAGFDLFGALLFASARPEAYQAEQMIFLATLGNQAAIALQNARYYQRQEEEKDRIIESEAEVRRWLARELHDGPTQTVSALAMRLNYLQLILEREPDRVADEIGDLEKMARRATREIRNTLFKLRPLALESQGLRGALEQYAARLREDEGIRLHLDVEEPPQRLGGQVESAIFAIIEEAVNNARKHSGAETISVRAAAYEAALLVVVRDNGRGFDVEQVQGSYDQRGSFGLVNMKERAALLGGTLEIASRPGSGTVITLVVPLPAASTR